MLQKDHISKAVYMNGKIKKYSCLSAGFYETKNLFWYYCQTKNIYIKGQQICSEQKYMYCTKTYPYPLCERATKRDFKIT